MWLDCEVELGTYDNVLGQDPPSLFCFLAALVCFFPLLGRPASGCHGGGHRATIRSVFCCANASNRRPIYPTRTTLLDNLTNYTALSNMPLLSAFALPELGLDQLRIVLVISVEAKRTRRVALDVNHTFLAAAAGSGASFSRSNFYIFYPQAAISTRFLGVILPIVPQIISARDLTRTRHSSWPS